MTTEKEGMTFSVLDWDILSDFLVHKFTNLSQFLVSTPSTLCSTCISRNI